MFANAQQYFYSAPWVVFTPASLLVGTLLSAHFLADGLRQVGVSSKAHSKQRH
jgi:ABC-type dipeptide/oligopeptide/nickel transport system permease subunit